MLPLCSGCLYVPQGRGPTGAQEDVEIEEFCNMLAAETELPIVVGFGVEQAEDVAAICATKATAAAVGSALVRRIAAGGSSGGVRVVVDCRLVFYFGLWRTMEIGLPNTLLCYGHQHTLRNANG